MRQATTDILRLGILVWWLLAGCLPGHADDTLTVVSPVADDSISYETPKPRDFNAMRFSMDHHHRYHGDRLLHGSTYLDFGAGLMLLKHANTNTVEPMTELHLRVGRQLSTLHSLRLGITRGTGYMPDDHHQQTSFGTIGAEADYLFSLSSYLLGYRPERAMDVSTVMGVGINHALLGSGSNKQKAAGLKSHDNSYQLHGGLQLKLFAGPSAAITVEPYVMLSSTGIDLGNRNDINWHRYNVAYGINLSYIYYFSNMLTPPSQTGDFKKHFANGQRWLRDNQQGQRRPMFIEYAAGINGYNTFGALPLGKTLGPAVSLGVGGWLSSAIGLRTTLSASQTDWSRAGQRVNMLGYASAAVDALLNPLGFTRHYDWETPAGLTLIAGYEAGLMKFSNDNHHRSYTMGYHLAAQPWVRLSHDTRLFVEPMYAFILHRQGDYSRRRDDHLSVKMGVGMLLGNKTVPEDPQQARLPGGYFLGGGGGWNTAYRKWKAADHSLGLLKNGLLLGGYYFDAANGVMLSGEYLTDVAHSSQDKTRWENWLISTDYLLNLSNSLTGFNPQRRWNISAMIGPTAAIGGGDIHWGGNAGLQLDYQLGRHLSVFYQHRIYWLDKRLYENDQYNNQLGTVISAMNVGMLYRFDDLVGPVTRVAVGTANGVASGARGVASAVSTAAVGIAQAASTVAVGTAHVASTIATGVGNGATATANAIGHGATATAKAIGLGVHNLFEQQRHPLFMEYSFGPVWPTGMPASSSETLGNAMQASVGWWMLPAIGLRASAAILKGGAIHTTLQQNGQSRDVVTQAAQALVCADLMFNPLGMVRNYNWDRRLGFHLTGGLHTGYAIVEGQGTSAKGRDVTVKGLHAGLQLWMQLQNDLRLFVEPTYYHTDNDKIWIDDQNKSRVSTQGKDGYSPLELNGMSVRIGVTALLRGQQSRSHETGAYTPQRGFFMALGGGSNFHLARQQEKGSGMNVNGLWYGGYTFNTYHSIRAQAEYLSFPIADNATTGSRKQLVLGALDYQLDLTSLLGGSQPQRRWDASLLAGIALTDSKKGGVNTGVNICYHTSQHWGLFYQHNVYVIKDADLLMPARQMLPRISVLNTFNIGVVRRF